MEIFEQLTRGKVLLEKTKNQNRPRCKKDVVKRQEKRIINWLKDQINCCELLFIFRKDVDDDKPVLNKR